ncbi:hypothetical protein QR680_000338 [Steinernema hermaphroditum]|uniref:Uncharacterized protein n=1 Tax=Steinernema hermaphroditum TaxID=289476 RepID=A0AA39GVS9_9BILA|nr:hypothetical protein QR680_000338 [Steinernema hermaphroditum]
MSVRAKRTLKTLFRFPRNRDALDDPFIHRPLQIVFPRKCVLEDGLRRFYLRTLLNGPPNKVKCFKVTVLYKC